MQENMERGGLRRLDQNRKLMEEWLDAYNAPDLDRAALLYAEDCEYASRELGIEGKGRAAQRAIMQSFLERFPDRKMLPRRIIADDRGVAAEVDFIATSPGGHAPRGRTLEYRDVLRARAQGRAHR